MIKFLQTLGVLWDKRKSLTTLEMERDYLLVIVGKNKEKEDELRSKLGEMNKITNPTSKLKNEILEVEKELNDMARYGKAFVLTCQKIEELREQLVMYKNNLKKKLNVIRIFD